MFEVICERVSSFAHSVTPYLRCLFADRLLVNLVYKKHPFLLNLLKFSFQFHFIIFTDKLRFLECIICIHYQSFACFFQSVNQTEMFVFLLPSFWLQCARHIPVPSRSSQAQPSLTLKFNIYVHSTQKVVLARWAYFSIPQAFARPVALFRDLTALLKLLLKYYPFFKYGRFFYCWPPKIDFRFGFYYPKKNYTTIRAVEIDLEHKIYC